MTEILVVTGFRKREIVVEIRPERLDEYDVTFEQVGRAVQALNKDIPGGQLKGEKSNVRVRTMGERRTPEEISNLILLTRPDGTVIRLSDVAEVLPAFEDKVEKGRFNGHAAGQIFMFKTPEQDAIKIATAVKAYVAGRPTMLGGALKLDTTTDLSRFIEGRLDLHGAQRGHGPAPAAARARALPGVAHRPLGGRWASPSPSWARSCVMCRVRHHRSI